MDAFPSAESANSSTFCMVIFLLTFSDTGRTNVILCSLSRSVLHSCVPKAGDDAKHIFCKAGQTHAVVRDELRGKCDLSTEVLRKGGYEPTTWEVRSAPETTSLARRTVLRASLSLPILSSSATACLYRGGFTASREIREASRIRLTPNTMGKAQHVAGLLYLNSIVQTKSLL